MSVRDSSALIKLGLVIGNQPAFRNITLRQLAQQSDFFELAHLTPLREKLFIEAFGENVSPSEIPAITASLEDAYCGEKWVISASILLPVGLLCIMLRLLSRHLLSGRFRAEDYCVCFGYLFAASSTFVGLAAINNAGAGRHMWDVTFDEYRRNLLAQVVSYLLNILVCFFFAKLSFLLYYRGLSTSKYFQRVLWSLIILIVCCGIADFFAHLFGCQIGFWHDPLNRKCSDMYAIDMSFAILHMVTEFAVLLLPVFVITYSNLPIRTKILLSLFFSLGMIVVAITILRCLTLIRFVHDADTTWVEVETAFWASFEGNLALILSCFPMIRRLVMYYTGKESGTIRERSTRDNSNLNIEEGYRPRRVTQQSTVSSIGKGRGSINDETEEIALDGPSRLEMERLSFGSRIAGFASKMGSKVRVGTSRGGTSTAGTTGPGSSYWTDTQVSTRMADDDDEIQTGLSPPPPPPPKVQSWLNVT